MKVTPLEAHCRCHHVQAFSVSVRITGPLGPGDFILQQIGMFSGEILPGRIFVLDSSKAACTTCRKCCDFSAVKSIDYFRRSTNVSRIAAADDLCTTSQNHSLKSCDSTRRNLQLFNTWFSSVCLPLLIYVLSISVAMSHTVSSCVNSSCIHHVNVARFTFPTSKIRTFLILFKSRNLGLWYDTIENDYPWHTCRVFLLGQRTNSLLPPHYLPSPSHRCKNVFYVLFLNFSTLFYVFKRYFWTIFFIYAPPVLPLPPPVSLEIGSPKPS